MSQHSAIGWTEATWNPVTGCSHVSPGCEHCYAETLSLRMGWSKKPWTAPNAAANVVLHPERLDQPLRWTKPRRVFVNSMSDLFHERIPDTFVWEVFNRMARAPHHQFQILTKRPARMRYLLTSRLFQWGDGTIAPPLPNVWLGVSVEDQRRAEERIPLLVRTPAAVRFLSVEPLLAPVDLSAWIRPPTVATVNFSTTPARPVGSAVTIRYDLLHWVIVGGESGLNHRPMEVAWAEKIAAQCTDAGVALYVKQDSGPRPGKQGRLSDALWSRKEYPAGRPPGDPTP